MERKNVIQELKDFQNVLSYAKNIGFFLGAGVSCALGLPTVASLTQSVENNLSGSLKSDFNTIKASICAINPSTSYSIEDILNCLRLIREITKDNPSKSYDGISGETAKILDEEICKSIFSIIVTAENLADISITRRFFAWLDSINKNSSKEIFTPNYDLVLEKAMEQNGIPYFDGFVGSYEPFFWPVSIDKFISQSDITFNWIRLWKIHGSLNWIWRFDAHNNTTRISRIGKIQDPMNELVIYPSKDKYDLSRRQPFIAYCDRLKNYLSKGELLFIVSGYSFSDQHINEVLLNGLRQNQRLYTVVFCYEDTQIDLMAHIAAGYSNLFVLSPHRTIINGKVYEWEYISSTLSDNSDLFWNKTNSNLILGDFNQLVEFLIDNTKLR